MVWGVIHAIVRCLIEYGQLPICHWTDAIIGQMERLEEKSIKKQLDSNREAARKMWLA